jgi:AMMECR1 domain-containing protein
MPRSALRDSRFSPIALKEVSSLSVGVSLLRGFERAQDHLDWQVGGCWCGCGGSGG